MYFDFDVLFVLTPRFLVRIGETDGVAQWTASPTQMARSGGSTDLADAGAPAAITSWPSADSGAAAVVAGAVVGVGDVAVAHENVPQMPILVPLEGADRSRSPV